MAAKVILYTTGVCPFCMNAKALLGELGVSYEERRVDLNPDLRAEMAARTNNARSVPQIFIGEQLVGGFSELQILHQGGQLASLLGTDT